MTYPEEANFVVPPCILATFQATVNSDSKVSKLTILIITIK